MQGEQLRPRARSSRPDPRPAASMKNWDFNPGFGGPIAGPAVVLYLSGRSQGATRYVPGQFHNKNANNPTAWTVRPRSDAAGGRSPARGRIYKAGVTWQASPRNKIGFLYNIAEQLLLSAFGTGVFGGSARRKPATISASRCSGPMQVDWTSPISSKLLLEGTRDSPRRAVGRHGSRTTQATRHDFRGRQRPGRVQTGDDLPSAGRTATTSTPRSTGRSRRRISPAPTRSRSASTTRGGATTRRHTARSATGLYIPDAGRRRADVL